MIMSRKFSLNSVVICACTIDINVLTSFETRFHERVCRLVGKSVSGHVGQCARRSVGLSVSGSLGPWARRSVGPSVSGPVGQ